MNSSYKDENEFSITDFHRRGRTQIQFGGREILECGLVGRTAKDTRYSRRPNVNAYGGKFVIYFMLINGNDSVRM